MDYRLLPAALLALLAATSAVRATSFAYHGSLQDRGRPAEGTYDIELTLYPGAEGGAAIAGPLVVYRVPVHQGAFNTQVDFGALTGLHDTAWLGVRVRAAESESFAALSTRTAVAASAASSVCPGAWTLDGNAGNPAGSYLGTADAASVTIKTNGQAAMTLGVPANSTAYSGYVGKNVIAGDANNSVVSGVVGAVVLGGAVGPFGSYPNTVGAGGDFAAILGGYSNSATGSSSTVAGGFSNSAGGVFAASLGGSYNKASADNSVALGSSAHARSATEAGNATGDKGTFVWNDSSGAFGFTEFVSSGPNQFLVQAGGGVAVNGTPLTGNVELTLRGSGTAGAGDDNADFVLLPRGAAIGYDVVATASDNSLSIYRTNSFAAPLLKIDASGNLTITGNAYKPGGGAWLAPSDRRIKQDVASMPHALDTLMRLRPVSFRYTPEYRAQENHLADRSYVGFVAQEYAEVFPDAVSATGQRVPGASRGDAPMLALDPSPALITTVAAVQELAVENARLREQLEQVLARLQKLEAREGR